MLACGLKQVLIDKGYDKKSCEFHKYIILFGFMEYFGYLKATELPNKNEIKKVEQ